MASLGLFIAGYAVVWFFAPMALIDIPSGIGAGLASLRIISFQRTRRINAFNAVLADSIDMLARVLRAGHSVVGAMEMLAEDAEEPAASEFGDFFKQQNLGLPKRDALCNF